MNQSNISYGKNSLFLSESANNKLTKSVEKNQPKRCLALSGKGAIGRWSIYFMARLEHDLGFSFYDEFDTFAGTSGGAMISASIILRIPFEEMFDTMFRLSHDMFSSNISNSKKAWAIARNKQIYDYDKLKEKVVKVVGNKTLIEAANGKSLLFTTIDVNKQEYKTFSVNLNKQLDTPDALLSDAMLGSSSMPFLFGEFTTHNQKEKVIDGGLICPNPSLDAVLLNDDHLNHDFRVLSISPPKVPVSYNYLNGLKKLFYVFLDLHPISSESRTKLLVERLVGGENCFFSQPEFPHHVSIDLHSPKKFDLFFNEYYYEQRESITKYLKKIGVVPHDREFKCKNGELHSLDIKIKKLVLETDKVSI